MKLTTKQIIIIAWIILTISLIVFCGYFGLEKAKGISYQKGSNDGQIFLANQIRSGIRVNYEDGAIMFVPNQ